MPKVIGKELADADALGRAAAGRLVKDTLLVAVHRPSNLHALRSYQPWSGEIERILYGLDPASYYLDVTNTNPWVVTFTPLA